MTLWTAAEIARATGGVAHGAWAATGVSIDTRSLRPGDVFVALTAARDGHDFVADALARGAGGALVARIPQDVAADAPLVVVDEVQTGLEALGRAARARSTARVVAVTGSVGKTSTKEMLAAMLSAQGATHASVASYNNHWGVPLTLARMPAETAFAVIEIGMNHPGEIAPLARLARPHVALVTTVGAAHLEAFENIDGIAAEKASIFEGLEPGGVAVYNADIAQTPILRAKADAVGARPVPFGRHAPTWRLRDVDLQDDVTVVQAEVAGARLLYKLATQGRHFALNALGALACVEALGADLALAAQALGRWHPDGGRGAKEVVALDPADPDLTLTLIDDSYNANPTSMRAALDLLAAVRPRDGLGRVGRGRRVAVLGDMKELGPAGSDLHAALAAAPAMDTVDQVHCVGPLMRGLYDRLPEARRGLHRDSADEMAKAIRPRLDAGDVVLVKGSLSTGLAMVVAAIRKMGHAQPDIAEEG